MKRTIALRGLLFSAFWVYLNFAILWTSGHSQTYFNWLYILEKNNMKKQNS